MKRVLVRLLQVVGVLVVVACAIRGYMVWDRSRDVLPEFSAVPAGPRAPAFDVVAGIRPGLTTLAEVQAMTIRLGWTCSDSSMRGLMKLGREQARAKMAEAEARGEDPDAVSGASRAHYVSKKEQNPQVQWNCESVDLSTVDPVVFRDTGKAGAALFIFDSAALPLRYIVTSRKFFSQKQSLEAWEAQVARYTAILGAPTSTMGKPDRTEGQKIFARRNPVNAIWEFADRRGTVGVMNMGPERGIDVREVFEVPWPTVVTPPAG